LKEDVGDNNDDVNRDTAILLSLILALAAGVSRQNVRLMLVAWRLNKGFIVMVGGRWQLRTEVRKKGKQGRCLLDPGSEGKTAQ